MSEVRIRPTGTQLAESLVPNPHLAFAAAFAALDDAGIVWCLLRGEADLDRPDQEVDLLVDEVDAARLAEVLGARGFAELAAWGRGSHRPFVGYDSTDDAWPKLDVVTRIDFGRLAEIETGAAAECLAQRTRVGDVAMLPRETASGRCSCTASWTEATSRSATLSRCAAWRTWLDSAAGRATGRMVRGQRAKRLGCAARHRTRSTGTLGLARRSRARGPRSRCPAGTKRGAAAQALRAAPANEAPDRCSRARPVDGPAWRGRSRQVDHGVRAWPVVLLSGPIGVHGPLRCGARRAGPARALGRLARLWVGYVRAAYHRRRGQLVVYDRFGYDVLLRNPRQLSWRSASRRWLLGNAIPSPDMAILLDVPAEVLAP